MAATATQMSFASATSSPILSPPLPRFPSKSFTFSLPSRHQKPNFLSLRLLPPSLPFPLKIRRRATVLASTMAASPNGHLQDVRPPALDSASDSPSIFDGTTRLYISYTCPYAQRAWITRNCKGLQERIKLVPIDLQNRPEWYKEKVYPANKVPSLEHNNEVRGESLDLIKYIDTHFEGPSLFPNDPAKKVFADVMFSYADSFHKTITSSFKEQGVKAETDAAFDFMEDALSKFSDASFFLGQFSLVDIAYIPFFERYIPFFLEVKNYDLTAGRPKLATWIQEMNKTEGYKQTQTDPKVLVESYKKRFLPKV